MVLSVTLVKNVLAYHQLRTACNESRCGENGPPIRFPFRLKDSGPLQPNDDCGYPGFDLFCVGNETAINLPILPANATFVKKIDYKSQQIHVYSNSNCLPLLLLLGFNNLSVNSTTFLFANRGKNSKNYTYLKCNSRTSCSLLLVPSNNEIEEYHDGLSSCTKMYEFESVPDEIYKLLAQGYSGSNIPLSWSRPDCRHCEAKRMGCRLKKDSADQTECFILTKGKESD